MWKLFFVGRKSNLWFGAVFCSALGYTLLKQQHTLSFFTSEKLPGTILDLVKLLQPDSDISPLQKSYANALHIFSHEATLSSPLLNDPILPVSIAIIITRTIRAIITIIITLIESPCDFFLIKHTAKLKVLAYKYL